MGANDGGVDHVGLAVLLAAKRFENLLPKAPTLPSGEARVDRLPGAIPLRQVAPWRSGPHHPEHRVDHHAMALVRWTHSAPLRGEQRRDAGPLLVRQLMPSLHPFHGARLPRDGKRRLRHGRHDLVCRVCETYVPWRSQKDGKAERFFNKIILPVFPPSCFKSLTQDTSSFCPLLSRSAGPPPAPGPRD
jgi:hypothetical protein